MNEPLPGTASFRVYFVTHADGRLTGLLMQRWSFFLDLPPPAAYGEDEADVLTQLEAEMQERLVRETDTVERYAWKEEFHTRTATLEVPTATVVKKRAVVGDRVLPLKLTYAWCRAEDGAIRMSLPRFDWWLLLESLEGARRALDHAVTGALLGSEPARLYDFRHEGPEYVREWDPSLVRKPPNERVQADHTPTLDAVTDDLLRQEGSSTRRRKPVGDGAIDWPTVMGWQDERATRQPPCILLVGPPGVGKSTEVRRLARAALARRREDPDAPGLRATTADRLLAGMMYLGMWQERVYALVRELEAEGDTLYVDRLAPLLRRQSDGAAIADLLAPSAAAGRLTLVAECTPAELQQARRESAAFVDLFTQVHVEEPSRAALHRLLLAYASRGGREFHPHALRRVAQLLGAYRRDRAFPGKAFAFLDAMVSDDAVPRQVRPADVEKAFARQTGLPLELIGDEHVATVASVAERLREGVVGQDAACDWVARAIVPFKAGLNPPGRPLGVLLFVGPTGVGKTELAKQTARYLFGDSRRLVRVDMSEYARPGSAVRLLSTGRGVRSLATEVRRNPLSVVLLDEIEKAHASVFDLLLGVLGEGRLTDDSGNLVDFRMSLIILTSNLGVRSTAAVGFEARADAPEDFQRAARDHFRPELLGRVDRIVPFSSLGETMVRQIVDLELAKIGAREGFVRREITLRVSERAKDLLAALGTDPAYGARPLRRVLETRVVTPLAVRLADAPNLRGRVFRFGVDGEDADVVL